MKLTIASGFDLPIDAVTQTFAILAKRGVGKTYTGAVMVEEMLRAGQQVVVADPIGVWWGLRSSADGRSAGYPIVVFGGEHADVPLEENSGEVIAGAVIENGFSAILDLSLLRKAAQVRFMTAFAETLYRLNRKPLHFCVDEADAFAPQRPMKGEERLLGAFEDIVRRGRARGLGVTLITQRAAVINKNVLTQIEVLICMRTIAPQDREAIDAWIEVHGTEKQRDAMMEALPSLPIGTAYFWSPGWLDIFKRVEIRKRHTFDSSSTPKVGEKIVKPKEVAAIDLDKLGEQIKSTVARQKENDPAELRREIARLKKAQAVPAIVQKTNVEIREVPALTDAERKRLTKMIGAFERVEKLIKNTDETIANILREFYPGILFFKSLLTGKLSPESAPGTFHKPFTAQKTLLRPLNTPAADPPISRNGSSNGALRGGMRRMMIALAQRPGLNKKQLGVRAGLSSRSGTFGTYLGCLRSNNWVEGSGEGLALSAGGLEAVGRYEPLPEGEALLNYWLNVLGESGAGRMLRTLAGAYPDALTKEQLGSAAQISHVSGTFGTYLGKLRTLELIEGRGELRAAKEFFE
jgi:hypothetical protein